MRILYLSADYGIPVLGNKGAAVHVRELTKAFQELGHDVIAVTPCAGKSDRNSTMVDLVEVGLPEVEGRIVSRLKEDEMESGDRDGFFKEVRALVANRAFYKQIETIHHTEPVDFIYERYSLWNFSGAAAAVSLNVPYILEVNAPLTIEEERYRYLHLKSLARGIEGELFQKADSIMAVSEEVKRYIRGSETPAEKVHVIPNAVDPVRFDPGEITDTRSLKGRIQLPENKFIVGFLGSLKKWHGLKVLVDAIKILVSSSSDIHLMIVGNGPLRESLEEECSREGIRENTTFTGEIPYTEVPACVKLMDIPVAPYDMIPDFYFSPLKIFEYMAMERPLVAGRIGQINEVVEDGKTGLLFEPGDPGDLARKILTLKDDPELMRRVGSEARKSILRSRSWKKNASEILNIVEGICTKPREKMAATGSPIS